MPNYVRFSPDVETPVDNEAALIDDITEMMAQANLAEFEKNRHAVRDAHAKSHGVLAGRLVIRPDLPEHLRQGIFASAGTHDVVVRLSSAPGGVRPDDIPQPRGFALKVMEVDGPRLLIGDESHNQDFLLVNIPSLAFGTIPKYKDMLPMLETRAGFPSAVQRAGAAVARGVEHVVEGVGREASSTLQGLASSNHHLLGETYFSQGALRFGDYIAKISVAPSSDNARALTGKDMADLSQSGIERAVADVTRDQSVAFDLRVQLCTDLAAMPVEDAAIEWSEKESPYEVLGTITFPPQDSFSDPRRVWADDALAFSPWNGVEAHQPLGSIMRIRRHVYQVSSDRRHRMNAVPLTEPRSLADVPA
ncbi:MAG: catalase family protein [Austwickia sp.]|jgi:hypothetical protein|nr:MAG: catalase family protein [Austwickia sp.]